MVVTSSQEDCDLKSILLKQYQQLFFKCAQFHVWLNVNVYFLQTQINN